MGVDEHARGPAADSPGSSASGSVYLVYLGDRTPSQAADLAVAAIWGAVAGAVAMAWLLLVVMGR